VLPTQIVASKLNGELAAAQVETVALAALAIAGLVLLRRLEPGRRVAGGVRGVAPSRRRLARPAARVAAAAAGWLLAAVLLLPHLTLLLISFVPAGTWRTEALPPKLSLANWIALGEGAERLRPVANSLWMALAATAAALALGLAAARLATRVRGRLGGALETLLALPWAIPGTVFALALAIAFSVDAPLVGRLVLVGTPWIRPLAYLVRSLPVTGRGALAGLAQLDPSLEEAAASLGAGRRRTLTRVVLPLLKPALFAGASLAFITALGDFVTSIVLYTYDTRPIAIEILSNLRLQDTGIAAVYGVFLMVISAAVFLLWGREESPA
jgi:iron(III) transport system permease protein